MTDIPKDLLHRLQAHRQDHVFRWWPELRPEERLHLVNQLQSIQVEELASLFARKEETWPLPPIDAIQPATTLSLEADRNAIVNEGSRALQSNEVAALVVAGGQGTRLGFDYPKGMYRIGPVSGKSLFQIHVERILAMQKKYQCRLPLLIMTSPATDEQTRSYFHENKYFGMPQSEVFFFCQGVMPALDLQSGQLLLEEKHSIFTAPNGHGGVVSALHDSGVLDELRARGIRQIFYFQVDNPLVKIADPAFIGRHRLDRASVSTKVVPKRTPTDKLGNLVMVDGRCMIIEYSDLPEELAHSKDAAGQLRFRAGNTGIHVFDVEFLEGVVDRIGHLPYHIARKRVPYIGPTGERIDPADNNACKFEMFVFDLLPMADRWTVVETSQAEEFAPLKNASGADSPESVRKAMCEQAVRWLTAAGAQLPVDGTRVPNIELAPSFALDLEELKSKIPSGTKIEANAYLS